MIIKATFTGRDGSLGYRKGQEYTLVLIELNLIEKLFSGYDIKISRLNGGGWCPYRTKESFQSNWKKLVITQL